MSTTTGLPDPLVPADIDVEGINGFLLHTDRLFHSELWALSTGEEFKAAVALWGHAWRQRPAGSLPNDDRLLAAFSGAGTRWKKVRAMALRGFVLCADGRYYHRVLCEDVVRAAHAKGARRERTAAASRARHRKDGPDETPPSGGKKANDINKSDLRYDVRNDPRNDHRYDVRHGHRNEIVADDTRRPLRSPIEVEGEEEEKRDIPAAACSPVPRADAAAPPIPWNSRANFDRVEARCREALPEGWVADPVVGPMARLEADGLDLEREIVPAILDIAAGRRSPIRTWRLLAEAVAERVAAQRQSRVAQGLAAVPAARPSAEEMVDLPGGVRWPEADLRKWVARHRENPSNWSESLFGPPPGEPGCKVPKRLLIAEAA